jgi:hypothetical protein
MNKKDDFEYLRPENTTDEQWGKIKEVLIGQGMYMEKSFHTSKSQDEINGTSRDIFDVTYENAQSPVEIVDSNLSRIIDKNKIDKNKMVLLSEGVSASGVYIPGWNSKGTFQRTQALGDLLLLQDASFYKAHTDPHGRSVVENFVNFVVGYGLDVSSPNNDINDRIKRFRKINKMAMTDRYMIKGFFIEGEYFSVLYPDFSTGDILLRRAPSNEIIDIETEPGDKNVILSYHREWDDGKGKVSDVWYPDCFYFENRYKKIVSLSSNMKYVRPSGSKMIKFLKYGNDDEIRGRVPMQSVLRFFKYYEDWLIDRIRLNHERGKVVWVRKIDTQAGGADYVSTNPLAVPRGGIILTETPGISYRIMNAEINADQAKDDGLAILYAICAGTLFPMYVLTQRTSESNFASMKKSDTPFVMMVASFQDLIKEQIRDIYDVVVRTYMETNNNSYKLPEKVDVPSYVTNDEVIDEAINKIDEIIYNGGEEKIAIKEAKQILKKKNGNKIVKMNTRDVPIGITFPDMLKEDALDQAKIAAIHKNLGIVSRETLSARAGYKWKEEKIKIMTEKTELGDVVGTGSNVPGSTSVDGGRRDKSFDAGLDSNQGQ